ncbi:multidrug effflux MFS transporter [Olivibacter sp. XZL3]|uniref:multidrug effflux MFS transporter n=1 Tax=Olivibacter sp. XZL3 TaxID=1735116 RepID=UPI001981033A|nr:multidrug effflux MFS transporter [Olivibacter sp. XZL3]
MKQSVGSIEGSHTSNMFFLAALGALMAFTSLSTDMYLPALPEMQKELHGNMELTITGFLIGFSIAQIFWGPISDRFGRKCPLALGMLLFIIGTIGCALLHNISHMIFWMVVQAFGGCTGPMISRAMVRDRFGITKAAQMLSTLMIIMAIAPIIGPLLGGQLLKISSWQSIFWFLTVVGVLMFVCIMRLPETLPSEKRQGASLGNTFGKYKQLLSNRRFMKYTLCVTFFYVGAYAFIAGSPFVYITYFGVEPQYFGWLFALNILGLMGLSFANRKLITRYKLDTLLRTASSIAMVAGIILAVLVKSDITGIYGVLTAVFFFFSMNGIIAATATASALDGVPEMAGTASALLGSLQYGSGILSTILLAMFGDGTPWTMSWIIALFTIACAGTAFLKNEDSHVG